MSRAIINMNRHDRGAVSLFVVIFATLLVAIVTVGFIQLMVHNQQQAADNDLSQSAYDSARAGVEDAKRLLLLNRACEATGSTTPTCLSYRTALNSDKCSTLKDAGLVSETAKPETIIQQSAGDNKLDQAYTCVKVQLDTDDYKETLQADTSILVPLRSKSSVAKVRLQWYSDKDLQAAGAGPVTYYTGSPDTLALPPNTEWSPTTPGLMRASFISTHGNFTLADLTNDTGYASTLFLYPKTAGLNTASFATDVRRSGAAQPQPIKCSTTVAAGNYACSVTIDLSAPVAPNTDALLRLTSLYSASSVMVQLLDSGGGVVPFNGVQPIVDSTGRASDLFRRVSARVTLSGYFPYPEGVDVEKNFCKDFTVTQTTYADTGCDPAGP